MNTYSQWRIPLISKLQKNRRIEAHDELFEELKACKDHTISKNKNITDFVTFENEQISYDSSNCDYISNKYKELSLDCRTMTSDELCIFRTRICPLKAKNDSCNLEDSCPFSHCISWHRRNPQVVNYRPTLCPNVLFIISPNKKLRVKNNCRKGRLCSHSHTKEEQMYHPSVYKTQLCRDWPNCSKHFCPFAHGIKQLRKPQEYNKHSKQKAQNYSMKSHLRLNNSSVDRISYNSSYAECLSLSTNVSSQSTLTLDDQANKLSLHYEPSKNLISSSSYWNSLQFLNDFLKPNKSLSSCNPAKDNSEKREGSTIGKPYQSESIYSQTDVYKNFDEPFQNFQKSNTESRIFECDDQNSVVNHCRNSDSEFDHRPSNSVNFDYDYLVYPFIYELNRRTHEYDKTQSDFSANQQNQNIGHIEPMDLDSLSISNNFWTNKELEGRKGLYCAYIQPENHFDIDNSCCEIINNLSACENKLYNDCKNYLWPIDVNKSPGQFQNQNSTDLFSQDKSVLQSLENVKSARAKFQNLMI